MNDFFQFRNEIKNLVNAWKKVISHSIEESGRYGETNTRVYLIDPILKALNWVDDGSKTIVDNEFAIKHKTGTGSADYALKVNGIPKILIEAKDVAKAKNLEHGYDIIYGSIKRTYPEQLSNYCYELNTHGFDIKFAILTNGKEWILYSIKHDGISFGKEIVFKLNIEELDNEEELKKLWSLEYNDFCGDFHRLREIIQQLHDYRLGIDKKAVQQLLECKDLLSNSILTDYEKNIREVKNQIDNILEDKKKVNGMPIFKDISEEERLNLFIQEASSSIINKILFIRILEDRNFLTPKLTKRSIDKWKNWWGHKDYTEIMNLFRDACSDTEKKYNGGLFRLNPYDEVDYDPDIIKKIIDILGDISFREIDSDIIGRIYEIYLGHILKVESEIRGKKRTKYQADNRERKKLGQYYTPKFVVDFIVKNTLGKLIEGKKPGEIGKIRVLDPACGSGSFLINAYDTLSEYYENWKNEIEKKITEKNIQNGGKITHYQDTGMIPNYRNIILKDNIHGVDLNDLSVQICEINLWLRALEQDKKLIKLNKNILHGNSLVTGVESDEELYLHQSELESIKEITNQIKDYYDKDELNKEEKKQLEDLELRLKDLKSKINGKLNENLKDYFGDNINIVHPFNWEVEFPQVMKEGGFDVIIGNPPYVAWNKISDRQMFESKQFLELRYGCRPNHEDAQPNLYLFFLIRSLSLAKKGIVSLIIPQEWLYHNYAQDFRDFLAKNSGEIRIFQFNPNFKVFKNPSEIVGTNSLIIFIDNIKKTGKLIWYYLSSMDENEIISILKDIDLLKKKSLTKEFDLNDIIGKIWNITSQDIERIGLRIESIQNLVKLNNNKFFDVAGGFQPPIEKVNLFEITNSELHHLGSIEKKYCYNVVYDASDMNRYYIKNKNEKYWIVLNDFPDENELKSTCPNLYNLLSKRITEKEENWWFFPNIRNYELIKNHKIKILSPRTAKENSFSIDENKSVFKGTNTMIISKKMDTYYIAGVLNSKLGNFWYTNFGYEYHGGKSKKFEPDKTKNYSIPIIEPNDKEQERIILEISNNVMKISLLLNEMNHISNSFDSAHSNQPILDPKSCKFGKYFDAYDSYGMQRETFNKVNEIEAKILSLNVKEIGNKLEIYVTLYNEQTDELKENLKAISLIIEDEDIRSFLFFSIRKAIDEKGKKGFGNGNILKLIKKIEVPSFITNNEMNTEKIKEVMKEFDYKTRDMLWKDESKKEKFLSLTELEEEIKNINTEIDEMIYRLYGITEDEKKIIEESLKD